MDNFIDNPKAKEYLKKIRDAGFCGDGSFEDEVAGIEKYNNALRAKYAFEKISSYHHHKECHTRKKKEMLNKCEIELLNKHYNVLTISQRDFVDKTFKGDIHDGNIIDGPMSEFHSLHRDWQKRGDRNDFQYEFREWVKSSMGPAPPPGAHTYGEIPVISYCSLLGQGKSHPFTCSHQNTRIKELEKKTKNLIEINKKMVFYEFYSVYGFSFDFIVNISLL